MPRGDNPNSRKALEENRHKGQFTADSAVIASEKANITKRKNRELKDAILDALTDDDMEEIASNIIARAKNNSKDFEILRDTIGQKPVERIEQTTVDVQVVFDDD